ncbi:MAG TPA: YfjI family protein [Abditibacteriaceae bacterium]
MPIASADEETQRVLAEAFREPPRPLTVDLLPVSLLEPQLIPEPFREWLFDIADSMSVPLDYPTAAALVTTGATVGRQIAIRPKRYDNGWSVPGNLWGCVIGRPGAQKTPACDEALAPLKRLAAERMEQFEAIKKIHEAQELISEIHVKNTKNELQKAMKRRASDDELQHLALSATAENDSEPPTCRRYIANDTTMEALGMVLLENPRGVLVQRDELAGFLKSFEKQGHETDRAFYLEGWNGNGDFTFDRVIRGIGQHLKSVCISVFGTTQPGVLAPFLRNGSGENADGLIQRFQIAVYPDAVPFRLSDRQRNATAKNRAHAIFKALDELDPASIGATVDDWSPIPYLRFSPEAQALFNDWWNDLETNKLRAGEVPAIESHLAKYRSLMPKLALLFHLIEVVDGKASEVVDVRAAGMAAAWCDYLESHARRIYQMAYDGDPEPALRLAERIRQSLPNPFKPRDVLRKGWSGLDTFDDVQRALNLLEERGWVQSVIVPAPGEKGGRPLQQVYINPQVWKQGGAE